MSDNRKDDLLSSDVETAFDQIAAELNPMDLDESLDKRFNEIAVKCTGIDPEAIDQIIDELAVEAVVSTKNTSQLVETEQNVKGQQTSIETDMVENSDNDDWDEAIIIQDENNNNQAAFSGNDKKDSGSVSSTQVTKERQSIKINPKRKLDKNVGKNTRPKQIVSTSSGPFVVESITPEMNMLNIKEVSPTREKHGQRNKRKREMNDYMQIPLPRDGFQVKVQIVRQPPRKRARTSQQ